MAGPGGCVNDTGSKLTSLPSSLPESGRGGQVAEADPADSELTIKAARASAEAAAIAMLNRELARRLRLDHLGLGPHA